jgi:imidazolonepropionase-like amidohydrolase
MRLLKVIASCLLAVASLALGLGMQESRSQTATLFEGARLITGDGSTIENSAFVVVNDKFTAVGRRGEVTAPAGATRVDLAGKTVMPAMVDMHGHLGFQNVAAGNMSKEMFTRDNLIDHLQRMAFHGIGGVVGIGDLVDRADGKGGRTNWGDLPVRMRDEIVPGAARFKTAGAGMAWPGAGAQGHASRADVMYFVSTPVEARAAVQDYVRIKPEFIKIWVDDREGRMKTLPPDLYRVIIEEAHRLNTPVGVHNTKLSDAKELMRAGVEGWLHVPVRGGSAADDEIIGIVKDRIARNFHPKMWMTPGLHGGWMLSTWAKTPNGQKPDFLDDPLLKATYSPQQLEEHWGEARKQGLLSRFDAHEYELQGKNAMALRAAGMRVVMGTDTGQSRHLIGYFNHMVLESYVAMGMTPMETIVASTRESAEIGGFDTGHVAPGKSADFTVLDANPLERISNTRRISKVYLRGQDIGREAMAAKWQAQFNQASSTR